LQVLHTGWRGASSVSASLAGLLLSHMSSRESVCQVLKKKKKNELQLLKYLTF
jgi:hypothetical protein